MSLPVALLVFCCLCSGGPPDLPSFPTRRSSDLDAAGRLSLWWCRKGLCRDLFDLCRECPWCCRSHLRMWLCNTTGTLGREDRKSTRLNSSHTVISYAVFCLKKKKKNNT